MAGDEGARRARRVTILGSTGSIGVNTLDLIRFAREQGEATYEVEALTANSNVGLLAEQARRFRPRYVAVADPSKQAELEAALDGLEVEIGAGPEAIEEAAARDADWVMAAIVGAAGLRPTLRAAKRGATIALANKECLVCAGDILKAAIAAAGGELLPVDSEHNAIFQVFDFERPERVSRLILTASGGPFRCWSKAEMAAATPAQAVAHPNWSMGAKISVDSATMMNKGLELIEAAHIFPISSENIEIIVHPQSVIHSMVEYVDGSVLAQLGAPDMRTPIAYTLAWPERMQSPSARLDLADIARLDFEAPDPERFPALRLAREAVRRGGVFPAALNAANEIAVAAFLNGQLKFLDIAAITEQVLDRVGRRNGPAMLSTLEEAVAVDEEARRLAAEAVAARAAA
ncbi:1-deoxy-D-xylulose-5-phosphate reductoisomerase [Amphiplicatus metriothermophilus]|uniref:1-deoxy-D-xylulose 5-phosphate reductoisomerase n=1 Tax=Amphiplicatus metriothermophilus TaxID=1519374 RepID=A0A239PPV8_9PROT|nr:1-deoxy-D-xylulose-5-phosphate reductoisomerase [Amphiplicatus metriothermophilus]MBB5518510.1 1-deoxy-D-xylulose-5-phosphate reductoisomerase [Amphiplicatus metriothermophilus]SNT72329.1 1-deoxy-D-xylulose 5-phosphate reductoisomerase [Amphiplicatus metriothermophilus]